MNNEILVTCSNYIRNVERGNKINIPRVYHISFHYKDKFQQELQYEFSYIYNRYGLEYTSFNYLMKLDSTYFLVKLEDENMVEQLKYLKLKKAYKDKARCNLQAIYNVLCYDGEGAAILNCFQYIERYKVQNCQVKLLLNGVNDREMFEQVTMPEMKQ